MALPGDCGPRQSQEAGPYESPSLYLVWQMLVIGTCLPSQELTAEQTEGFLRQTEILTCVFPLPVCP